MTRNDEEESGVARLLRAAGGRANPSDELRQAVRTAVHSEWRSAVGRRRLRRTVIAVAATISVVAIALWVNRAFVEPPAQVVAGVSRSVGDVRSREGLWGSWQAVPDAHSLRAGESLMTGADGHVAVELRDGVSLRLDHDTRIAFIDAGRIDVSSGAIYIDSGASPGGADALRVGTPAGIVRHVGTQYEARIVRGGTRIRVREGRVDVMPAEGASQTVRVGEQLLVSGSGSFERGAIAPSDAEWEWVARAAPAFDIDGRPVREFLAWVARETGREVSFASAESEAEASRAVLSGSVEGLAPYEALAAVLPATSLQSVEHEGRIVISLVR